MAEVATTFVGKSAIASNNKGYTEASARTIATTPNTLEPITDSNKDRSELNQSDKKTSNVGSSQPQKQREQWEKNLINSAMKFLSSNQSKQDNLFQTAPLGTSHTIIYSSEKQQLSIINNSSEQVIYQTINGRSASISKFSEEQKRHFSDRPPTNDLSNQNQASIKVIPLEI